MATTIKATHEQCGFIWLLPSDVHLKTFAPSDSRDFYEFICPSCGEWVQKAADEADIELLRAGGIPETRVFLPIEALDPARNLTEPLTIDEVLDFQLSLQQVAFLPVELTAQR